MRFERFLAAAFLTGSLGIAATPVAAQHDDRGPPRFERGVADRPDQAARPRRRVLPPEVAYRDPRVDLRPRGRPDFLIHGYLPRYTERPIYNEPPPRFPER